MSRKWPRRRLIAMIGAASVFTGTTVATVAHTVFPEMSIKVHATNGSDHPNLAWTKLQLAHAQEVTGTELVSLKEELISSPDVNNCGGSLDFSKAEFKAVRHKVANSNNQFLAGAWLFQSSRHILIYWKVDEEVDYVKTRGLLYQYDAKEKYAQLVSQSINTAPVRKIVMSVNSNSGVQPQVSCMNDFWGTCSEDPRCTCSNGKSRYNVPVCGSVNIGSIVGCCASCIFTGPLAAICVFVFCPICLVANACSTVTGTAYCCH